MNVFNLMQLLFFPIRMECNCFSVTTVSSLLSSLSIFISVGFFCELKMKECIVTRMESEAKTFFFNGENYPRLSVSSIFSILSRIDDDVVVCCLAYISNGKVMGWGNKAIEIRNVQSGALDGVFMHKRAQKLK